MVANAQAADAQRAALEVDQGHQQEGPQVLYGLDITTTTTTTIGATSTTTMCRPLVLLGLESIDTYQRQKRINYIIGSNGLL